MSNHIEVDSPLLIADNLNKGKKNGLYKSDIDIPFIVFLYTNNLLLVIDYFAQNKQESLSLLMSTRRANELIHKQVDFKIY